MSGHAFRFGCLSMDPLLSARDLVARAARYRDLGFTTFQVSDHFDRSPMAPLVSLAAVATAVDDIRVGTLVLANDFRHPAVLAKELATLDLISEGRLEVGLGAGWMTADYAASGIPLERPGLRIDRLSQSVSILDSVLRADGPVTLEGEHYRVAGLSSVPPPVQRPRPPLLIGGGGRRILTLAAQVADIVSINLSVQEGTVGPQASRSSVAEASDEKLAWVRTAAGPRMESLELHLLAYWACITDEPKSEAERQIAVRGLSLTPDELLRSPHCLIGPVEDLVERMHRLRERWQVNYVTFYGEDADEMAPLIARVAGT